MPEFLRAPTQLAFSILYITIMALMFVFVLPIVRIREWMILQKNKNRKAQPRARLFVSIAALLMAGTMLLVGALLAGCTLSVPVKQSRDVLDRSLDFAKSVAAIPYEPIGNEQQLSQKAQDHDLLLSGEELSHIAGAAEATTTDPVLVATVIEQELRWLDDGELERDILSALAGENPSIGLGQVRLSTAQEIEQEDPFGLLPEYDASDQARTERIRRLANDDWNPLYVSSYLYLLAQRFPGEAPLDLAQRYIGATPDSPREADQADLLDVFDQIYL
ncbi:MAG: hypothetical protein Q8P33_00840 [bacterium]|nr:hypothetical protein [bacterium]